MSSNVVPNCNRAQNLCATANISKYAITTLSKIRGPFPRTMFLVTADCKSGISSKICVGSPSTDGPGVGCVTVSFAKT